MNLSLQNLSKTYPNGVKAMDQINLDVSSGMFGLLGPNGAGKSTLMRTIATLQAPDAGEIHFNGQPIFADKTAFRRHLGYLPQEFGVYPKESALELLNYFAILKGIASKKARHVMVERVLEITNLQEAKKKHVSTFSGGMRQRFGIAQLLLNQPQVIIVDEPTAGLDPAERTRFLNVLRNIGSENIVLFSTHLVEDVMDLCRDMAVINQGRLLAQMNPAEAIHQLDGKVWEAEWDEEELNQSSAPFIKLSSRYKHDHAIVHRIYADQRPTQNAESVAPKLEDFYFLTLQKA
ncbi:MAG: ABC transporter ATP-binding protein [Bacteroidota bacterium]